MGAILAPAGPGRPEEVRSWRTGYAQKAIAAVKAEGMRLTSARYMLFDVLEHADRPLSAQDITDEIIARKGFVDVMTIHRLLAMLLGLGLVYRVAGAGDLWIPRVAGSNVVGFTGGGDAFEIVVPEQLAMTIRAHFRCEDDWRLEVKVS